LRKAPCQAGIGWLPKALATSKIKRNQRCLTVERDSSTRRLSIPARVGDFPAQMPRESARERAIRPPVCGADFRNSVQFGTVYAVQNTSPREDAQHPLAPAETVCASRVHARSFQNAKRPDRRWSHQRERAAPLRLLSCCYARALDAAPARGAWGTQFRADRFEPSLHAQPRSNVWSGRRRYWSPGLHSCQAGSLPDASEEENRSPPCNAAGTQNCGGRAGLNGSSG